MMFGPEKKVLLTKLVHSLDTHPINKQTQRIIPSPLDTLESDVDVLDFNFEVVNNSQDVLFDNGV